MPNKHKASSCISDVTRHEAVQSSGQKKIEMEKTLTF